MMVVNVALNNQSEMHECGTYIIGMESNHGYNIIDGIMVAEINDE